MKPTREAVDLELRASYYCLEYRRLMLWSYQWQVFAALALYQASAIVEQVETWAGVLTAVVYPGRVGVTND